MKLTAFVLAVLLCGCATLFAGGPDSVPINTNPPGAYVYVNGQVVGQTPMVVELDRSRSMADIRIYYPGFVPIQISRYKSFNNWTLANFFIVYLIFPVIVDVATGNWQRFDDDAIAIGLTPGQAPPPYGVQPMLPQQSPPMLPPAPAPR